MSNMSILECGFCTRPCVQDHGEDDGIEEEGEEETMVTETPRPIATPVRVRATAKATSSPSLGRPVTRLQIDCCIPHDP